MYNSSIASYQLIACSDIQVDQQIFSSYGLKTNEDKFMFYGWINKQGFSYNSVLNELISTDNESFTTRLHLNTEQDFFIRCNISIPAQLQSLDVLKTPKNKLLLRSTLINNINKLNYKMSLFHKPYESNNNSNKKKIDANILLHMEDDQFLILLELRAQTQLYQYFFGYSTGISASTTANNTGIMITDTTVDYQNNDNNSNINGRFSMKAEKADMNKRYLKSDKLLTFIQDFNQFHHTNVVV